MLGQIIKRILAVLAVVGLGWGGIYFAQQGFNEIAQFKKLERIPQTTINTTLVGEAHVIGQAVAPSARLLFSPKTNTPAIYYRYLVEEERKDSDGDTSWHTIEDYVRAINFTLHDESGSLNVKADTLVDDGWSVPKSFSVTEGKYRYSEWRLEPDEQVLIYGWLEQKVNQAQLRFDQTGEYVPLISKYDAGYERGQFGLGAVLRIWAGVSLLGLAVLCLIYAANQHRILGYLLLLTTATSGSLVFYGTQLLQQDVALGAATVAQYQQKAQTRLQTVLENKNISWQSFDALADLSLPAYNALSMREKALIRDIRVNIYKAQALYARQVAHFPENIAAKLLKVSAGAQLKLNPEEEQLAKQQLQQVAPTAIDDDLSLLWLALAIVLFIVLSVAGLRFILVKRLIENIPTSKTKGVCWGMAEVKGVVIKADVEWLSGPVTHQSCSWYRYQIEEKRRSGKNTKWVTILDEEKSIPFYCVDDEGRLLVKPTGADVLTQHHEVETVGDKRYSEWALRHNDKLYALGYARANPDQPDQLYLGKPADKKPFLLSNLTEAVIMFKKAITGMLLLNLAFSSLFFAAIYWNGLQGAFAATDYLWAALIGPFCLTLFMIVLLYNDLIFLKQRADRNWSNIDVSLKKRADLLPNLQNTVQAYLDHEKDLQENLVQLRNGLKAVSNAEQVSHYLQQEQQVTRQLVALSEKYPELKANELMEKMMQELIRLENEIALMRAGFNDAVTCYNERIELFPDVLIAKAFGFQAKILIPGDAAMQAAPNMGAALASS